MKCFSVIVSSYKQNNFIYDALDSILSQDYKSIQLIVVDDATPYFSIKKVEQYIKHKNHGNIIDIWIHTNKHNMGTVKNFNIALEHVKGDLIVTVAGDDLLYDSHVLSRWVDAFEKYKCLDPIILVSQVIHYDKDMKKAIKCFVNKSQAMLLNSGDNSLIYGHLCLDCFIPAIGCVYSKKAIDMIGKFDEKYRYIEDWPTYLKLARNGVNFRYLYFESAKHRDGGISHYKSKVMTKEQKIYHKDLIEIMKNEILHHYQFAPRNMWKRIYHSAYDRVIISQYREDIKYQSLSKQIVWLCSTPKILGIVYRGCKRKILKRIK